MPPQRLVLRQLLVDCGFDVRVFEEILDDRRLDLVCDSGAYFRVAELVLCLGVEDRVVDLDGDCTEDSCANILRLALLVLRGKFIDTLDDALLECGEVDSAVVCELCICEGVVVFVCGVCMAEGELQGIRALVYDLV